ncbi:MAG: hypothetical protein QM813_00360 [Verrucomicrobiota bacterium]
MIFLNKENVFRVKVDASLDKESVNLVKESSSRDKARTNLDEGNADLDAEHDYPLQGEPQP